MAHKREVNFVTEDGISFLVTSEVPELIYKYRPITVVDDRKLSIEALINDQVFFNNPNNFNDPYDSSISFNKKELRKYIEKKSQDICFIGKTKLNAYKKKIYKHLVDNFYNNIHALRSSFFVSCFAERVDDEIMWTHYADCGKGFAICYESSEFQTDQSSGKVGLLPVLYTAKKPNINLHLEQQVNRYFETIKTDQIIKSKPYSREIHSELENQAIKSLISKKKQWSYEKEYRAILDNPKREERTFLKNIKPKAIILGEFINEENAILLAKIARDKDVHLFQMFSDYSRNSNRLMFKEIILIPEKK